MDFSAETRNHNLIRLSRETFDLLVIGGGITGAGIASEATRCGYKVALVEKGDFAGGASSKSSKLIHGGLRYLATLKFRQVFRACEQRYQLARLAPHLVQPLPFILPVYADSPQPLWQIGIAMWLYDAMAGFRNPGRHQMRTVNQVRTDEPCLNPRGLIGAARYYDCATDDARLTLVTLRDAHRAGAVLANYTKVRGLLQAKNRIVGVQARDRHSRMDLEIQAHLTVSAVGPWTDRLLQLTKSPVQPWLQPTKGVHLVIRRQRLPSQAALAFPNPDDKRFMFLLPWGNQAIIGTTDTNYRSDPNNVFATAQDVAYILEATHRAFPAAHLTEDDIISTYAGLRPLIGKNEDSQPYSRSRQHRICEVKPGLIAVAGGKLTTHRAMAQETLNQVAQILASDYQCTPSRNEGQHPLPGGDIDNRQTFQTRQQAALSAATGLSDEVAGHLVTTYGTEVSHLLQPIAQKPALAERVTPDLPVIKAQIVHAIRHEMALTLNDVMTRRTHLMTRAADQGLGAAESVAGLMATELGWTSAERAAQIAAYRREVAISRAWRNGKDGSR